MASQAGSSFVANGYSVQPNNYSSMSGSSGPSYLESRLAHLEQALGQRSAQEYVTHQPGYQYSNGLYPQPAQPPIQAAYQPGYAAAPQQSAATVAQPQSGYVNSQYEVQPNSVNAQSQAGPQQPVLPPQNSISPTGGPVPVQMPVQGQGPYVIADPFAKLAVGTGHQSNSLPLISTAPQAVSGPNNVANVDPSTIASTATLPSKQTSRVRILTNRWNAKDSKWEDHSDSKHSGKAENVPEEAATFRRHMDADNEKKIEFEEIEIHSKPLKDLILQTDLWWRDMLTDSGEPASLSSPFDPFVFSWDKYVSACDAQAGDTDAMKQARNDLNELLQQLKKSKSLESWFRSRDAMKASRKVKFEFLWTHFSHCSKVYARTYMNELQMLEVRSCSAPPYTGESFRVTCGGFDWDGTNYLRYNYHFYIKEFSGEIPISSLEVFPTEYYCNEAGVYDDIALREKLVARGRKYCDLCAGDPSTYQCHYEGAVLISTNGLGRLDATALNPETSISAYNRQLQLQMQGDTEVASVDLAGKENRVILDNHAFLRSERNTSKTGETPPLGKKRSFLVQSECVCGSCAHSPLQQWRLTDRTSIFTDHQERLSLLPPRLLGFALKKGIWCQFGVDQATRVSLEQNRETNPFEEELQLDPESKKLLMALVKGHESHRSALSSGDSKSDDAKAFDIIEGKGQGVAIMLHGPPGVGKTLTAETVALATGRPLLTVSVAEIGIEPPEVERKLSDVFADAARWGAVLLVDEADVFVEERTKFDLKRNAMVSVLLRCLEYYDGIIIMTTNRIKAIDIAVQSRIHLAIQYHDLTQQQRIAIYENRIKRIPESEVEDRKILLESLTRSRITRQQNKANGRQIRNIVIGARALAKSEKKKLTLQHLETVDETVTTFITSMSSLAQRHKERNEAD